jgi:hypothetical protein
MRMTTAGGKFHSPVTEEIEHRRFFSELHGMMHRQCIYRHPKAQPLGSLRHSPEDDVGRGEERKLRLAMNLSDPVSVESESVGQLGLFHKLFEARRRRRALRTLYFGKETTFHRLLLPLRLRERRSNYDRLLFLSLASTTR